MLRPAVLEGDMRFGRGSVLLAAAELSGMVFADKPFVDLIELHPRSAAMEAAEIRQRSR